MRVLVGTMESGEQDFARCVQAVRDQQDADVKHIIVSGQSEQEAHRQLFTVWNDAKSGFDLFLKVDADTVLSHSYVIRDIIALFSATPRLTGIQAWLHDYMTDSKIYGMSCIARSVTVSTQIDPLYCDRADTGHDLVERGDQLPATLNPAGLHCHHASPLQAFRFGVHRAKKNQQNVYQRVKRAWENNGRDSIRGFALLGFNLAHECERFDYASSELQASFNRAQNDYAELLKSIQ